jgi:hypothetical protein
MRIDALYIYATGPHGDAELRFSLRSVAAHAPWVRKVWVFGDRPEWLSDDKSVVEHVPHEYVARLGRWKVPLRNTFLMTFLASLIPGLADEFLWFADDYILLEPVTREDLCRVRVLEDLAKLPSRGKGLYKDALWRTHDTLKRLGCYNPELGLLNFECHVPHPLTRKRVWDAYCDLQDFVSEDRYYGLLCHLAIYNHAAKHEPLTDLVWLKEEDRFLGFYGKPPTREEVSRGCHRKAFLNFDDAAWGVGMEGYLAERFPEKSKFES